MYFKKSGSSKFSTAPLPTTRGCSGWYVHILGGGTRTSLQLATLTAAPAVPLLILSTSPQTALCSPRAGAAHEVVCLHFRKERGKGQLDDQEHHQLNSGPYQKRLRA
ncbi:hypothetical protein E2C01_010691 [Portunus trituberculatus]|uniref:Uncharacterized protein n=1 Tax=Portunus trituberculatus TaxID=210409 RepID=A0A5B7D941_PORTR|nr:hypothetical protein [Portunus trituberculatus]